MLRLYDSGLSTAGTVFEASEMPSITRVELLVTLARRTGSAGAPTAASFELGVGRRSSCSSSPR